MARRRARRRRRDSSCCTWPSTPLSQQPGHLAHQAPLTAPRTAVSTTPHPSRFPQDLAASLRPCLCSSLHLKRLPPTPSPQILRNATSPKALRSPAPTWGSRSPLFLISIVPTSLVPRSCGWLICPWDSHSPGPHVCMALGTLGMPRSDPASASGDAELSLPPPLHRPPHTASQVIHSLSPCPSPLPSPGLPLAGFPQSPRIVPISTLEL